ncbi:MAG: gliding motility-associated C-terminal domain-containing protein [Chitinophagaceae bacterium]|nr:gliding motility-associated C-terminal domain-containing protein [Chitinophagaceae bacterium]
MLIQDNTVAQLCQGSLGDPIVNLTFGTGTNPGLPLTAATTNYTYVNTDCPEDGFYAVRNSTINCFSPTWHTIVADHTGNTGGYFMLVNASLDPGAFYVDTVRGLCSNTNFEFAAWVANVIRPSACDGNSIQPNLTFTIEKTDGTILQTYNSSNIAPELSAKWKQVGFFFATPAGVSDVVLRIFNNSRGGCGNDLALDDITFRPCGPQILTSVDGNAADTIFDCGTNTRSFTFRAAVSMGYSNPFFQWQKSNNGIDWTDIAGANSTAYTVNFAAGTPPGKYLYRLAAAELANFSSVKCRVVSAVLAVIKGTSPVTTIHINSPVCEGQPVTFTATGGVRYLWTRENGGLLVDTNPFTIREIDAVLAGKIYVKVSSDAGCYHFDSAALVVLPKPKATVAFNNADICIGKSIQMSAGGGLGYSWIPGEGLNRTDIFNPVASPAVSTTYLVTVTNINTCTDTASVSINLIKNVQVNAGPDKTILAGGAVQLTASATGDAVFLWSPASYLSNPGILQPIASPLQDRDYILQVTSTAGCSTGTDTVHVFVFKDIYIPTAFSPDGNGYNDTWSIPALNAFPGFALSVYNRNGRLVYQSKNRFIPWDGYYKGEPLTAGAYVYIINLNDNKRQVLKGTVMLVR